MSDPKVNGRVVEITPAGSYTVADTVCVIETLDGK
jgi:vacuolar-type H+-ATPase catalytic subunit A/Vma1